jgi:hypothetical protein
MSTLIGAYTFNEEATHDYSGNKYHLTNSGCTFATTTSPIGYGYDMLVTSGNSASTTSFASFTGLTGITFFCYFKYLSGTGYLMNNSAFNVQINSGGNIVFTVVNGSSVNYTITSSATLVMGTWYLVACVWNGSSTTQTIYVNSTLDTSGTTDNNINAGNNHFTIGSGTLAVTVNVMELRNTAFTGQQLLFLIASPGGTLVQLASHNLAVGDLISDNTVNYNAVVTWVIDGNDILIYPYTTQQPAAYGKYGNIYNASRQYIMEITNDFDGNGNSQISIKWPIASFADYASPANTTTFDYRGLSGGPFLPLAGGTMTGDITMPNTGTIKDGAGTGITWSTNDMTIDSIGVLNLGVTNATTTNADGNTLNLGAANAGIIVLGNTGNTNAINVYGAVLHINSGIKIPSGAGSGYVLTSDASGNATWMAATGTTYSAGTGIAISGTTISLASGVVTPGSYNNVTVDTYGRVTAGSNTSYLTSAYYQTVQYNQSSFTQRGTLNFTKDFNVSDDSGNGSTDVRLRGKSKLYQYYNY